MHTTLDVTLAVICGLIASSGFWGFIQYRDQKKDKRRDATSKLLLGLAHDRILQLGRQSIETGSISVDEFTNLTKYLYEPYAELGGNGIAKRIVDEVQRLPIEKEGNNGDRK